MHLLWSLLLARPLRPESHHQFLRSCSCSESLTPVSLLDPSASSSPPLELSMSEPPLSWHSPSPEALSSELAHLLHWSCCHLGRWTCCFHHLILLAVLAQLSGKQGWMLSWSGTLQCWSHGMESWSRSWLVNEEP